MMVQCLTYFLDRVYTLSLNDDILYTGSSIKSLLVEKLEQKVPFDRLLVTSNGKAVGDEQSLEYINALVLRVTICNALVGGKGGFGAMLRAMSKQQGAKKTTDFGACRDLSGRRLRHVNEEQILLKWKEAQESGTVFDTEQSTRSGIDLWFLDTPSWAAGAKSRKYLKPRRKTRICLEWERARVSREPPVNAPVWWGCPRGPRCEVSGLPLHATVCANSCIR